MPEIRLPFGIRLLRGPSALEKAKQGPIEGFIAYVLQSKIDEKGYIGVDATGFRGQRQAYFLQRARLQDLYTVAFRTTAIRTACLNLRNEIFRRGLDWVPRFTAKCTKEDCGEESAKEEPDKCPKCGSAMKQPDPAQRERLEQFMDRANVFGQSLEGVLREAEDDVQIADDAWLLLQFEYIYGGEEEKTFQRRVMQIQRLDPAQVEFELDDEGIPGQMSNFCPNHRTAQLDIKVKECGIVDCGLPTLRTMFRYNYRGKIYRFSRDELIHWSKYSPSKTYGYSPLLSMMEKALTLIGMDRFFYDMYYMRKMPPGIVTTTTDDAAGLMAEIREMQEKIKQDPAYFPWIAVSAQRTPSKTEYTRLGFTPDELQYGDVRKEMRERISGLFGVSNIWMGSTEGVGGISRETQQLVVMSRVVEAAQRIYNTKVLPAIVTAFGITDWKLELLSPEETTEETRLAEDERKATIATLHYNMGFEVSLDPQGEFVYTVPEEAQDEAESDGEFGKSGADVLYARYAERLEKALAAGETLSVADIEGLLLVLGGKRSARFLLEEEGDVGGQPSGDGYGKLLRIVEGMQSKVDEISAGYDQALAEPEKPSRRYGGARVGGGTAQPTSGRRSEPPARLDMHRHPIVGHPGAGARWHPISRAHRTCRHEDIDPSEIEMRRK